MTVGYTERFSETHAKLGVIYPASYAAVQRTAWVSMENFHRAFAHIIAGDVGTSIDAIVEAATDSNGSNPVTIKSITQLTQAGADDNSDVGIEIQSEDLSAPSGAVAANFGKYKYIRLAVTPVGASIFGAVLYGTVARYAGVDVSGWDEIVD